MCGRRGWGVIKRGLSLFVHLGKACIYGSVYFEGLDWERLKMFDVVIRLPQVSWVVTIDYRSQ